MTIASLLKKAEHLTKRNSPLIMTAFGVSGTITTAYLASRASFDAARAIDREEGKAGTAGDRKQRIKERTKLVWRFYIPATISGVTTVGCIIGASRVSSRRMAALSAAYSLSEHAFSEYREKVVEKFGEKKEQSVRDEIAQDRVNANAPAVVLGSGPVLCCELWTGRYFNSDTETLRKAENQINAKLLRHDIATLDDFYYLIGLPSTEMSADSGWQVDKLMELEFSAVLTDGRPCMAFNYNYVQHF